MENELQNTLNEIKFILLNRMPKNEEKICLTRGFYAVKKTGATPVTQCFERPLAGLTLQGKKFLTFGSQDYSMIPGSFIVSSIDAPSTATLQDASMQKPYLGMFFYLDRGIIADLSSEITNVSLVSDSSFCASWRMPLNEDVLDAFLRMAKLMGKPQEAQIIGPMIMRELHYRLLTSPQGQCLRSIYLRNGTDSRIFDAVAWLKRNLAGSVSTVKLADMAHMSLSSFHRHFKGITGESPLQYHKKLRLFEAQRQMLVDGKRAAEAAEAVGYESVSQFNREYRRLFGNSPARDINNLKSRFNGEYSSD